MPLVGELAALALLLGWLAERALSGTRARRALVGDLAGQEAGLTLFIRGLFVTGNEFFSRAPENPRDPTAGLTVHKWSGIPEAYSAADARACADVMRLLLGLNSRLPVTLTSGDPGRQPWSDGAISVGPHYKSGQILDTCEPRLVAYRNPNAFRNLLTQELFEAREGIDYGLLYKGRHPVTRRSFWVIMGLGDPGTEAAAHFLQMHASRLGHLTGSAPFAAVISVETLKGPSKSQLRALIPRPAWWRRLLHRSTLEHLTRGEQRPPR